MCIKFSPKVLRSEQTLNAYLYGKETIEAIKMEAHQPYVAKGYGKLGTLEVAWLVGTFPMNIISCLFLEAAGNLLYLLHAKAIGQKLLVQANYISLASFRLIDALIYRENLLVSTVNALSPDQAEEIYTHPPILADQLKPAIIFRSFYFLNMDDHHIHFDKIGGQCSGMSDWAAHLYFQTKPAFRNEEHHLVSITSQLTNGSGKEAALWQCMQVDHPKSRKIKDELFSILQNCISILRKTEKLGLKDQTNWLKSRISFLKAITHDSNRHLPTLLGITKTPINHLKKPTADKVAHVLKNLRQGFYAVRIPNHRFNFIKGKNGDFIMDPNTGLIAIRSAQELEKQTKFLAKESEIEILRLNGPS